MSKILIAYFSHSGNTQAIAGKISDITGGDLFEIKGRTPYPRDYAASVEASKKELARNARPELMTLVEDFDSYDEIILGFPNWCGTMPMPVWTFLEEYDFRGKQILPFCSHGGGGLKRSEDDLAGLCPDADIRECLSIYGSSVNRTQLEQWLKG